ncbi:two-component system response regulator [Campylobacter pinnipediorum subsp. pinnipediorum]|uniref:Two-component system response regulator n=1 Tax=Campylobacter pinnipediorum subsp. pinnipediorum TaxID=1660067 RepID=A0AAX0LC18_9BACT|nr:response regulator transcription factor [Campylobacter pinnipediorum]OPA81895.1 two-component system response regulator [Campylobacter pinnipediorum subsp. pinnipediorum]
MIDVNILSKLKNISVLLVEDDENTRIAITQSLQFYCKKIVSVDDGLSGFNEYFNGDFDIVITDINLPNLNGLEMLEEIKKRAPHLKSIIITSYDTSENMLASIELGAYNYLRKPFKIEELQTTILMATKGMCENKILIKDSYEYDLIDKILLKNKEEVAMTKIESKLFYLLASNANKTVGYDVIEDFVWNDKAMSNEALRMVVKKIRLKTDQHLIENISGVGYRVCT